MFELERINLPPPKHWVRNFNEHYYYAVYCPSDSTYCFFPSAQDAIEYLLKRTTQWLTIIKPL